MVAIHQNTSSARLDGVCDFLESSQSICSRCDGLLIESFCISPKEGNADFQIPVQKCLQCGDVFDPTILKNRMRSQHYQLTLEE